MSQRQDFYFVVHGNSDVDLITTDRAEAETRLAELFVRKPNEAHFIHPLHGYLPPPINPDCQCRNRAMAQMVCPFGHMTECHYPQTCNQAQCGHCAPSDEETFSDDGQDEDDDL